jgi:hypothetical protein
MSEEPPLTLQEKIAIARALLSDASVLAEMNEVLDDKEKVKMLRHISTPSNKEQPDLSNGHIQGTDEPNVTNLSQDAVMEEQAENEKSSSSPSVSFSPEIVITPKPRRTPKYGRGGNASKASSPDDTDMNHPIPQRVVFKMDKEILLKKQQCRPHIHRYTLCIKTTTPRSEEAEQQQIQTILQKFLETILQADPKAIIPSFLEWDRNDKNIPDISSALPVSSMDSFHLLKNISSDCQIATRQGILGAV